MNKFNHIETLLKTIVKTAENPDNHDSAINDFDTVSKCVDSYVDYHNEAVRQGKLIQFGRFHMSEDKFMDYITNLHEHRKALHQNMIDSTIVLNGMCNKYNMQIIYDGPLDKTNGRNDDNTRYGVAGFAEELCRDFYKTSDIIAVPEKARQAYQNYANDIKTKSSSWDMMQNILARAKARNEMDSHDNPEYS